MILGRFDQNGVADRFWVAVTLPEDKFVVPNLLGEFTVTFVLNSGQERVFDAVSIVLP